MTLFAPRAQRELRAALLWIERDNPTAADALLTTAMEARAGCTDARLSRPPAAEAIEEAR